MPPALARTNFTDRKAPAFFISAPVCRSIASNSADPTKANAGRGPRMFRRSSGWRWPPRKCCEICLTNRNARPICAIELWRGIERVFPEAQQNAGQAPRLANTLNVSFPGFASETLLMALDLEGDLRLEWLGLHGRLRRRLPCPACDGPDRRSRAASAIRFSLGKETTAPEIEQTIEAIERILRRLNSPASADKAQHALV